MLQSLKVMLLRRMLNITLKSTPEVAYILDDRADEGRQEEDDVSTWTTRTGRMVFKKADEHGGRKSVWTKGVRNMIRSQASEAVLNKAWNRVAERWVECVWWRRGQPWMQHPAGLAHVIRQQGLGDRVAWGKRCYEEVEKATTFPPSSSSGSRCAVVLAS